MRISHKGGAKATALTAALGQNDLVINVADATGWPDGSVGPFYATIGKGSLTEEKVLCSGRSGNALQVWSDTTGNGRGVDDTVAQEHPINTAVEHVWTAVEADQANAHIEQTDGAHGYPAASTVVTTNGDQTITGVKTIESPVLNTPQVNTPTVSGGTVTGASKISVSGAQTEQEFRVRNVFIGDRDPLDSEGNDGDMWIRKG